MVAAGDIPLRRDKLIFLSLSFNLLQPRSYQKGSCKHKRHFVPKIKEIKWNEQTRIFIFNLQSKCRFKYFIVFYFNTLYRASFVICNKKVKQSRYRPGVAQRVPGS
jgi:hypothetical protein